VLFVTFFPHLIAGPILHHSEMMPQFAAQARSATAGVARRWGLRSDDMAVGATWFVMGLAKKVLLADRFGPVADALYARPQAFGSQAVWVGVLCYAAQLYFDFSGYSDMALGLARMFSITLPLNFNSPYKAASMIDFWQRWHMTLTRYLNLYLYNPVALAMSRRRIRRGGRANARAQRTPAGFAQIIALPMVTTMFLAGVWHGAGLQFLCFGMAHAVYLTLNHAWRLFAGPESRWRRLVPTPMGVSLTFACVLVGQVFFRAPSVSAAVCVLRSLVGLHGGAGLASLGAALPSRAHFAATARTAWPALAMVFAGLWALPNTQEILDQVEHAERSPALGAHWLRWRPNALWAMAVMMVLAAAMTMMYASTSFLYFQF
jgi:D-alanyl-lipoteichoic acid acyltransferase DltB (MBOAT superfamily)